MFNHTKLNRCLAAGMVITAAVLPATARADLVQVAGGPPATAKPAAAAHPQLVAQTGFVWSDAGIGAGGAVVLITGCAGGAAAMRRRWTIRSA